MKLLQHISQLGNQVFSVLSKGWSALKEKIFSLFSSFRKYDQHVSRLLKPRDKARKLVEKITHGRSAKKLFENLEWQVEQEKISDRFRGQASLILSNLYEEGVCTPNFTLTKNQEKMFYYQQSAKKFLGENAVLSKKAKNYLVSVQKGGEYHYAYQVLREQSKNASNKEAYTWSNKVLSYLYLKGVNHEDLQIQPDKKLADEYSNLAKPGILAFETACKQITKKLIGCWLDRHKIFGLIQKVADCSALAQYHYGHYLDDNKKEGSESYFQRAAEGSLENALTFKTKGYIPAKIHLINKGEQNISGGREKYNRFAYQIAKCFDKNEKPAFNRIKTSADNGDFTAIMQSALLLSANPELEENILKAQEYFAQALQRLEIPLSDYNLNLFEKLCLRLANYYENIFVGYNLPKIFKLDENATNCLNKIIYFLQAIPVQSKHYSEAQFRIGHFRQFFLKNNEMSSLKNFYNVNTVDDSQDLYPAIWIGFKKYWEFRKKEIRELDQWENEVLQQYESLNGLDYFNEIANVRGEFSSNPAVTLDTKTLLKNQLDSLSQFYEKTKTNTDSRHLIEKMRNICTSCEKISSNTKSKYKDGQFFAKPEQINYTKTQSQFLQAVFDMKPQHKSTNDIMSADYLSMIEKIYYEFFIKVCEFVLQKQDVFKEMDLNFSKGVSNYAK